MLSTEEIRSYAEKFDIGNIKTIGFLAEGFGTSNHKVTTDQGIFVIKETYDKDVSDVTALYNLLTKHGIPTCNTYPLKSNQSQYSLNLSNGNSIFVQNFLPGKMMKYEKRMDKPELYEKFGEMIGKTHAVTTSPTFLNRKWNTKGFDKTNLDQWVHKPKEVEYIQDFRKDELMVALEDLHERTKNLDTSSFLRGICHTDWYVEVFMLNDHDDVIGILDFNAAVMHFIVLDIKQDNLFKKYKNYRDLFYKGYFAHSPKFTEEEILSYPLLDMVRRVDFISYFGWRAENNIITGLSEGEDIMQGYWDFTNDFIDFDYEKPLSFLEKIVEYARDFGKIKE